MVRDVTVAMRLLFCSARPREAHVLGGLAPKDSGYPTTVFKSVLARVRSTSQAFYDSPSIRPVGNS